MLLNDLKTSFRTLRRNPGYTSVNIVGLALAMMSCVLILFFVRNELSYESFLPDADRVYRLALDAQIQEQTIRSAYSSRPLGPTLEAEIPEIVHASRLWFDSSGDMVLRYGDRTFPESRVFFADASFFDVFGIPLIAGDPQTALRDPYSMVLTRTAAERYFGEENPLGKVLNLREPADNDIFLYTITGVMEDLPGQTHLEFDFLGSYVTQRQSQSQNWLDFGVYTYVNLEEEAGPNEVEAKIAEVFAASGGPQILESFGASLADLERSGSYYRYFLQPVPEIHLHSRLADEIKPAGDIRLVYMFGLIGFIILALASINFVNLATARSVRRSAEAGVRKTLGSGRGQLMVRYLLEALALSGLAMVLSVVMLHAGMPFFSRILGYDIIASLENPIQIVLELAGLTVVLGLGAGAYPAFFLSSLKPATALRGKAMPGSQRTLRDTLIVFQFSIATALIACTAIVYGQMRFLLHSDPGFDAEQIVVLEGAEVLRGQGETFRESLRAMPGVVRVTNSELVPGRLFDTAPFKVDAADDAATERMQYTYTSYDFVETYGLNLVMGRSLSRDYATDSLSAILNESAVRQLGLREPVGQRITWPGEAEYTVIGVVEDFHFSSYHRSIEPLVLLGPDPRNQNRPNLLISARINAQNRADVLRSMEEAWGAFAPQSPFVYSFVDRDFQRFYQSENRTARLISLFAGLAVLIACIGLLGLSAYMIEQRKKEIALRKVLGASVPNILRLFSMYFLRLVAFGILIGSPLAYLLMSRWLEGFAYAIHPGLAFFVSAGVFVLLVAVVTIGSQCVPAARSNPALLLRRD